MEKKDFSSSISIDIPIRDEYLILSCDEIMSILNNQFFSSQYNKHFENYIRELGNISGIHRFGRYSKLMNIDINEDTQDNIIVFSKIGLLLDIAITLDCLNNNDDISIEDIRKRIETLKKVKNSEELKINFPYLYENIYVKDRNYAINMKMGNIILEYETAKRDFIRFNRIKDNYKKAGLDFEEEYQFAKRALDFNSFIKASTTHFSEILNNLNEIEDWIKENPLIIKMNSVDTKKVYLYVMYRELENIYSYSKRNPKKAVQNAAIMEKLMEKYKSLFPDDETQITFRRYLKSDINYGQDADDQVITSFKKIEKLFQDISISIPSIKGEDDLPELKKETQDDVKSLIKEIMDKTIDQDIEAGSTSISRAEIEKQVDLISVKDEKDSIKKEAIREKIKMILYEIKPIAIQKGIGIFSSRYVYFYPNGMVATDNLTNYGALYIMPVHIYKEARYKNNLDDVKLLPGVTHIHHKRKKWLDEAKKCIETGTSNLSTEDIIAAENAASIDFPYTIEGIDDQLQKSLGNNEVYNKELIIEAEKRKKRIELLDNIDKELTSVDDEAIELSQEDMLFEEEKLNEEGYDSFDELYSFWKMKHKNERYKRNPAVALYTKNRARDEDGNYCCELCDSKNFESSSFHSHHMIPLSMGGVDNIYNTICLCPNCHQYAHSGKMTLSQENLMFEVIRNHILKENPEYIHNFNKMISPVAETEDYYDENKDQIDHNFSLWWEDQVSKNNKTK